METLINYQVIFVIVELFIMRHGKAEARAMGSNDADRTLTGQGREEVKKIGRWITSMGYTIDLVAASPLKRARETADLIAETTKQAHSVQVWDLLSPGGDVEGLLRQVGTHAGDGPVLLVGHEPQLSMVISRIISRDGSAQIFLAKGSFARIKNVTVHGDLSGELHSLITPKQLSPGN